jgi:hypothetical protein
MVDGFDPFNLMGRVIVDLYSFIPMYRHNPKPTYDIRADNF